MQCFLVINDIGNILGLVEDYDRFELIGDGALNTLTSFLSLLRSYADRDAEWDVIVIIVSQQRRLLVALQLQIKAPRLALFWHQVY
jgi:hypothetical protein